MEIEQKVIRENPHLIAKFQRELDEKIQKEMESYEPSPTPESTQLTEEPKIEGEESKLSESDPGERQKSSPESTSDSYQEEELLLKEPKVDRDIRTSQELLREVP